MRGREEIVRKRRKKRRKGSDNKRKTSSTLQATQAGCKETVFWTYNQITQIQKENKGVRYSLEPQE